jgi:hypothetical protein
MNNQIPGRYFVQLSYSVHETNLNFTNNNNNLGGTVCYFVTLYIDYRASNGRINKWCVGKGLEGSGNGIFKIPFLHFTAGSEKNHKIPTQDCWCPSQDMKRVPPVHYHYTNLLGMEDDK